LSPALTASTIKTAMDGANIEQFQAFVRDARRVLESEGPPVEAFRAFVAKAEPLATDAAREYLRWFAPHADRVARALVADDLIQVAGYHRAENSYTRLLGWSLGHGNDTPLAAAVQHALIALLRPGWAPAKPLAVLVERSTEYGTPDLVLHGDDLVVVIEAKTVTREHLAAQTGEKQTVAYGRLHRDGSPELGIRPGVKGFTVLLSIERDEPADSNAEASTFAEVALCILDAIDRVEASFDQKWPYRAIASHWLIHAMPGVDVRALSKGLSGEGPLAGKDVLRHLSTVTSIERLVPVRGDSR
jgi:hypothetical protein